MCQVCKDREKVINALWNFKCSACKNSFNNMHKSNPFDSEKEIKSLKETISKLKNFIQLTIAHNHQYNNLINNMTEPVDIIIGKKNFKK